MSTVSPTQTASFCIQRIFNAVATPKPHGKNDPWKIQSNLQQKRYIQQKRTDLRETNSSHLKRYGILKDASVVFQGYQFSGIY